MVATSAGSSGKPRKAAKAPAKKAAKSPAKPAKSAKKAAKSAKPARASTPSAPPTAPAPASEATGGSASPPPPPPPPPPAAPVREPALQQGWIPVPGPTKAAAPVFDPATGAWLPIGPQPGQAAAPAGPAPDSGKKGTVGYVLWTILLWIDLVLLAGATLFAIAAGAVLLFAPDSAMADDLREQLTGGSRSGFIFSTLLNLLLFGIIPLLWVLGTRRVPIEGTKRFLHLHLQRRRDGTESLASTLLWGVAAAAVMLAAVAVLITVYTCATESSCFATPEEGEEENPAIQGLLEHLDWPLAILVAVGAGVGEEIFFRGFLQRYLGVWGQAVLFGLAHATGGYLPQILFAFGLGVAFGLLVKRGWSLWTLILAHALYDFVLLALAILAPELG